MSATRTLVAHHAWVGAGSEPGHRADAAVVLQVPCTVDGGGVLGCEFLGFGHQVKDLWHEAVPAAVAGCITQAQRGRDSRIPQSSQVNTLHVPFPKSHTPHTRFVTLSITRTHKEIHNNKATATVDNGRRPARTIQTVLEVQGLLHAHVRVWDLVQHKQVHNVVQLQQSNLAQTEEVHGEEKQRMRGCVLLSGFLL